MVDVESDDGIEIKIISGTPGIYKNEVHRAANCSKKCARLSDHVITKRGRANLAAVYLYLE